MKKIKFEEKPVVIITGGNNGIGLYMAFQLLQDGYLVAVFDLSGENIKKIAGNDFKNLLFFTCDITQYDKVKTSVEKVIEKWGRIDILVNNACLALFDSFEEKELIEIRKEFEVNYFGYLNMIKAVFPYMKQNRKGIIHNVSSGVGLTGFSGLSGYTSTKGAIEALTKTLSIEFEKYNISVNIIHPPLTNTESASPLGVPKDFLEDPKIVGKKLAKKILSTKDCITPDLKTRIGFEAMRLFSLKMGRMFSSLTEKERAKTKE